jgi:RNA polymerase sigma factor for flagellar operon FliA
MDRSLRPEVDTTARQDSQHVEALIEAYAPLVKYLAHRLACRLPASVDLEDLISTGVLGLLDAIQKYDPQRPDTFKTYAECRIRGAMLDYVRALDWVPRSVRHKEQALTEAYATMARQQGRPATDEEVAAFLGLDCDTFEDWLTHARGTSLVSLEHPLERDAEGNACTALAQLADEAPNPSQLVEAQELTEYLAEATDALPEQEKVVLALYYHEDLTMHEIGAVLEVTESRISQIRTKAMLHLRAALQNLIHDAYAPAG